MPSRRLGMSLGVDIVPLKTCTQNCVYCELGVNSITTMQRKAYVPMTEVMAELKETLKTIDRLDYITITGSGEPTLNSEIGLFIDNIRQTSKTPIAILTNGTLFSDPAVRADCAKADVLLPSLDAYDQNSFNSINKPHSELEFDRFVAGLIQMRREFIGQYWLEVFLLDGYNTEPHQIEQLKAIIDRIAPDKIQLNTAVRPAAQKDIKAVSSEKLLWAAEQLGTKAEVIVAAVKKHNISAVEVQSDKLLAVLKRRPCTVDDLCIALQTDREKIMDVLERLEQLNLVRSETTQAGKFFMAG